MSDDLKDKLSFALITLLILLVLSASIYASVRWLAIPLFKWIFALVK